MAITANHMTQFLEKARLASQFRLWAVWLLVTLGAVPAAGCGTPVCQADRQLGSCCESDGDCDGELVCLTRFPAGLCTRDCELDHLCPAGSRCIHIVSQSKGDLGRACLKLCGPQFEACRADYRCAGTSEPEVKVCFPE